MTSDGKKSNRLLTGGNVATDGRQYEITNTTQGDLATTTDRTPRKMEHPLRGPHPAPSTSNPRGPEQAPSDYIGTGPTPAPLTSNPRGPAPAPLTSNPRGPTPGGDPDGKPGEDGIGDYNAGPTESTRLEDDTTYTTGEDGQIYDANGKSIGITGRSGHPDPIGKPGEDGIDGILDPNDGPAGSTGPDDSGLFGKQG